MDRYPTIDLYTAESIQNSDGFISELPLVRRRIDLSPSSHSPLHAGLLSPSHSSLHGRLSHSSLRHDCFYFRKSTILLLVRPCRVRIRYVMGSEIWKFDEKQWENRENRIRRFEWREEI